MRARKTCDVRLTQFSGGRHWYVQIVTTGKRYDNVFADLALAEAAVDRQLAKKFAGLKPRRKQIINGDIFWYVDDLPANDAWTKMCRKREKI